MIIYNLNKPENPIPDTSVGVTGDHLTTEIVFFIKNLSEEFMGFHIHLRFRDGSVNTVAPDDVKVTDEGTYIHWIVNKTDIFCHGFFELQIECRKEDTVMQTEIIRLFAHESLSVEDKEYANPNSETLALRDEIQNLLTQIDTLKQEIELNKDIISLYNLDLKADKADTYTKSEIDSLLGEIEKPINYLSSSSTAPVQSRVLYTSMNLKAEKIDTYTKKEIDAMFSSFSPAITATYATRAIEQNNNTTTIFTKEEVDMSE